jgi:AcrR family transcriptional regulator
MTDVKSGRRFDASRRREQARRTREAVLLVARERLLADGYAATTIARIADDAGTSVETVYKTFGGKAGLVRALWEQGLSGSTAVPVEERSDEARSTDDPAELVRSWGRLVSDVAPRAAPIMLLVRAAAAAEPELAQLVIEADQQRRDRMLQNARHLKARGWLRKGISVRAAADVMWTYSSSELYELLVVRSGWSASRYGTFVADAMIAALLP